MKTNSSHFFPVFVILSMMYYCNTKPIAPFSHGIAKLGNNRKTTRSRYVQRIGDKFIHHAKHA